MRRRTAAQLVVVAVVALAGLRLVALAVAPDWSALNVVERDIAPFNAGIEQFERGDLVDARASFEQALDLAPQERRCAARRNLVLTLEARMLSLDGFQQELERERVRRHALDVIAEAPGCLREDAADRESASQLRGARGRLRAQSPTPNDAGQQPASSDSDERGPYVVPPTAALEQVQQLQRAAQAYRSLAGQLARTDGARPAARDDPKW